MHEIAKAAAAVAAVAEGGVGAGADFDLRIHVRAPNVESGESQIVGGPEKERESWNLTIVFVAIHVSFWRRTGATSGMEGDEWRSWRRIVWGW